MTDQWTELEAIAKAATPGPWRACKGGIRLRSGMSNWNAPIVDDGKMDIAYFCREDPNDPDVLYVGAADPTTILALIQTVRDLTEKEDELRAGLRLSNDFNRRLRERHQDVERERDTVILELKTVRAHRSILQEENYALKNDIEALSNTLREYVVKLANLEAAE